MDVFNGTPKCTCLKFSDAPNSGTQKLSEAFCHFHQSFQGNLKVLNTGQQCFLATLSNLSYMYNNLQPSFIGKQLIYTDEVTYKHNKVERIVVFIAHLPVDSRNAGPSAEQGCTDIVAAIRRRHS